MRRVVRGVCVWYQSENVAKALASCRYRIGNFVELIGGVDVVIGPRLPREVARRARVVACIRPLLTPGLAPPLSQLRKARVELIADYDDLLFAGDVSGLPASVAGSAGKAAQSGRLRAYAAALDAFDRFTVATRPLAARLHALKPGARVNLIPNGVSEEWVAQGRALYPIFRPGDPLILRYFAGSPSHDADFATLAGPLNRFLRDHKEVRLEVVGPVKFDSTRFPGGRVASLPKVSYEQLPSLLGSTWVNLAPLSPSAFNDCKSAIKVLESGAFGCPTLASANDDVLRHRELGAPVTLCHTEQDWYAALEGMLDLAHRNALGRGIADYVAARGTARSCVGAWLSALDIDEGA